MKPSLKRESYPGSLNCQSIQYALARPEAGDLFELVQANVFCRYFFPRVLSALSVGGHQYIN